MIIKFNNEKLDSDKMEHVGIKKIKGINPMYFIYFMEDGQEKLLDTTQTSDEIKIAKDLDKSQKIFMLPASGHMLDIS